MGRMVVPASGSSCGGVVAGLVAFGGGLAAGFFTVLVTFSLMGVFSFVGFFTFFGSFSVPWISPPSTTSSIRGTAVIGVVSFVGALWIVVVFVTAVLCTFTVVAISSLCAGVARTCSITFVVLTWVVVWVALASGRGVGGIILRSFCAAGCVTALSF